MKPARPYSLPAIALAAIALAALAGCRRAEPTIAGNLPQRGYLWQRDWTPAVGEAVRQADLKMDGLVVLGAEIHWNGVEAEVVRASVGWEQLIRLSKPCGIALRISPFPGPFADADGPAKAVRETAVALVSEARARGVALSELQVDFDCAQAKLSGYRLWVKMIRNAVAPVPVVITTLPAWLNQSEFPALVDEANGYVLQVHSVPTSKEIGRAVLFDPVLARKWVAMAAKLNRPFSVALPTYWCLAGFASSGKLLGVTMDSVQPRWPEGTRVLEFGTDAESVAGVVREWLGAHPRAMKGLLWYRVPVGTDQRNWRWPTLCAVMTGRNPSHRIEVRVAGENPVDVSISNTGESEEKLSCGVMVTWEGGAGVAASDPLPGWTVEIEPIPGSGKGKALFLPKVPRGMRLSPGDQRAIGWLRYDTNSKVQARIFQP